MCPPSRGGAAPISGGGSGFARSGYPGHYDAAVNWLSLYYTLTSDDTAHKGGRMSHQPEIILRAPAGPAGFLGASAWLDFYADVRQAGETGGGALHEADYTAFWAWSIQAIRTAVETGWTAQTFPQRRGDAAWTHEWYILAVLDTSDFWDVRMGALSPYAAYYLDMDDARGGRSDWGITWRVPLAAMGLSDRPLLKDIAITPSVVLGINHGQLRGGTRPSCLRYALDVSCDLNDALKIPAKSGIISLNAFLCFRQGFLDGVEDGLYGGITLGYRL